MYSLASLPLAHALVASSSSSRINPSDLEDSLLQLVQEHHHASLRIHNLTVIVAEKAQNEATKKAVCVAELLVEAVNGGVKELVIKEKRTELEIRALTATISSFIQQTDRWLSLTCSINTAIKEIGDFENWMKIMEFDSKSINAAIHNIHQA
ncbi:biogenesis of lysosome-related organelles complex 1 subunit 1 isoform X1 [Prunus persica]|uniref:biogenesis of lysosome-related organelles complex 1 subunit 1 isoform X1 n=1 Tax=Prunus persica TaxID=3760 RepID=UPI0009AB957A|nr:biogenesis of lysosome-related organelles complex 1 subunit 1 isoform X1 [Prunus persica]XP_020420865.1 biogenesis of lysosome-related organelles complex 1 subunit 1 isoform X1 [Prunus persica]XP_020420866.1 biogenesis of lysosome-related organelles complex 1 subunit 1 isoform X1 [Prunus persica]